jgi:hypothetical protein
MRNSDGDTELTAEILRDQVLTHAVEVATESGVKGDALAREVEQAFVRIGDRCKKAGMVPVSMSMFGVGVPNGQTGAVTVVVMCNWIFKDNLEAMQRQQALMPGPGTRR